MNLGDFKIGIYFGFDGNNVVLSVEQIEKCAEVRMHRQSGQYNPRRQRYVYRIELEGSVLTWAGTAKDQPLNFSDLSGKEGGPCPRLKLECHQLECVHSIAISFQT